MSRRLLAVIFVVILIGIITQCTKKDTSSPFRNIDNPKAEYVGKETCKSCHWQVYETFMRTGMGQSWDLATRQKSAADFDPHKALVYDTLNDLFYKPFWEGDGLYILEFRLQGSDTIHRRLEKVSYIVGSGQHTNSHIIDINGFLFQAPITFYTQKRKWDLAPGFEKGMNTRFDRKIEMECMTCHNAYPEFDTNSLNKYVKVQQGIDCERCHGPGSLHVAEKRQGQIIDTSQGPDYSIVNPRRLSIDEQNNLCQRCHLQGIAVLNPGRSFTDFLPSKSLRDVMHVFMPVYSGAENHMIMASHVERMKMSACFLQSQKMSCITCHNPHVSVKETPRSQYLNACASCHSSSECKEQQASRTTVKDDCVQCHMPRNGSIDIPHVAVTDHYIRAKPITAAAKEEAARFIAMKCYNADDVPKQIRARAFLEFYERYEPQKQFLDSAAAYLDAEDIAENDADRIRLHFLKSNFSALLDILPKIKPTGIPDAWTAYRIGEACMALQKNQEAIPFLERAVALKPLALDFQNKLATAYAKTGNAGKAQSICTFILQQHPRFAMAHFTLGVIAMQSSDFTLALSHLNTARNCDPNHVQTLINLAVCLYQTGQKKSIPSVLQQAIKLEPDNQQIRGMLNDLNSSQP